MASVVCDPGGRKRIAFVDADGNRKAIRLGLCTKGQATTFKIGVQRLLAARFGGLDPETARWLADLPDDIHRKLEAVGLANARTPQGSTATLGAFLSEYIGGRVDVKSSTRTVFERTRRHLIAHFGADKPLHAITEGDADAWRLYLVGQGLAPNTINRTCGIARQFFRAAVRRKLIRKNPFTELKTAVTGNKAREHFINHQDAQTILDACPDMEWKLIFALARYGGLRTPSETLALMWDDVNWGRDRMTVHSPKTEHHPGGELRIVPLFPELRPLLTQAFAEAPAGSEFVIARHRHRNSNLRTHLERIIVKAGLKPWPKLFQNLRASRETELCETFPLHVVVGWLGNTARIAAKHYLQTTDEHFERAAQNRAQYPSVSSRTGQEVTPVEAPEKNDLLVGTAASKSVQDNWMGDTGLEPVTR